ncbi:MAG: (d)CMP kinase [Alphaproteobacteria bacterium]|nr:(d)CMP kinase [Alphaproteobacteria bacterium]
MIIAIDGPAASGKGTIARRLAAHYHLPHLDTGLIYRAAAAAIRAASADPASQQAERIAATLDPSAYPEVSLRSAEMGEAASVIAAIPAIRAALLDVQRRFAAQAGGAVLDGRDIGTVIAPQAAAKIFVTATPQVRAQRRFLELQARGETIAYDSVLADIHARDERDSARSSAPLRIADDTQVLDTSELGIEAAVAAAITIAERQRAARSC